jgi:hypothetical protein
VVICVSEFTVKDAETPPKVTRVAPVRCEPMIVTVVCGTLVVGVSPVIVGAAAVTVTVTVKVAALTPVPAAVVTRIVPLAAPAGVNAVICESEAVVKTAGVPSKLTVVAPVNALPEIDTLVPAGPLAGANDETVGAAGAGAGAGGGGGGADVAQPL